MGRRARGGIRPRTTRRARQGGAIPPGGTIRVDNRPAAPLEQPPLRSVAALRQSGYKLL